MMITDPKQLKNYFRARNLKPKDYMGQNFLIDEEVLNTIIKAADLKSTDTVLEVGPGLGVLTEQLVKQAKEVWAVEKDPKLFSLLKSDMINHKNLNLINEDILRFHVARNILSDYKVVANIPYYLTSKLFKYFLESEHPPKLIVLMIQKEVGERVSANAGELSILGISVQIYSDVELVTAVPKENFWPMPEVDSVVLKITPMDKYPEIKDKKLFFRIVKVAFAGKRKQIQNTLMHGFKLSREKVDQLLKQAGIEPSIRPQDLEIKQWISLYSQFDLQRN